MHAPKVDQPGPLPEIARPSLTETPRRHLRNWLPALAFAIILVAVFSRPLIDWVRFAISKERNTYLLLVPFITAYLIRTRRREIHGHFQRSIGPGIIPAIIGAASLLCLSGVADPLGRLSLQIFALLNFLLAGALLTIGANILRQLTFPITFLIFAVPVPTIIGDQIEIFLQYTSAEAAYWLMSIVGIPMIRDGVNFRLPNIFIKVAQECSGYNSTFALFMVSTIAAYLFLKSPASRAILCLVVIPLAILRNGFRITTLATLCVYDDTRWIDSELHHNGGPLFFALSLIPFFILLWWLRKADIAKRRNT
jgi:exosortase C (VPDSG-CTERM-specific)